MSTATRTSSRHSYSDIQLSSLTSGAQLLVWSARQWLACAKTQRCVHEALALPYAQHNISQAIMPLDESMTLLALGASRQIELGCLCASVLREDERTLLAAFRYLQCNDLEQAMSVVTPLIHGCLKRTFCRTAAAYTEQLQTVNMKLNGTAYLQAVRTEGGADD